MGSVGKSSYQIEELHVPIKNNLFIYSAQTNSITQRLFFVWYLKYRLYFYFLEISSKDYLVHGVALVNN